jgi:lipoprotein-anchoring transpeptidase ErfK/SrfK
MSPAASDDQYRVRPMSPIASRVAPRALFPIASRTFIVSVLLATTVLAAPARAEPLVLDPVNRLVAAPVAPPTPPPVRVAARSGAGMGGGFIEFLFGHNSASRDPYQEEADPYAASAPAVEAAHGPLDPRYLPQTVTYEGPEKAGTIVIDTQNYYLYLVQGGGTARRYGIGVGRPGFTWAGVKEISMKKEWPDWRPPTEMLQRRPDLPTFMAGGPENPLGARAMYLGSTLYRIHGSNEPWTIGTAVSSGCIRMRNEDVIDLYQRVKVGTRVIVS